MSRWTLLLILLLVLFVLAFKFLPWYVLVALVVVFVLTARFFGKRLLLRLVSIPFRAKGAVLRHATATVHALQHVDALPPDDTPDDDDDDDEDSPHDKEPGAPRDYYRLEVTVSPKSSAGPFHHWEIGELALVHPDFNLMAEKRQDLADLCDIKKREVQVTSSFTPDDDDEGPHDAEPKKTYQVGDFVPDQGYKLPGPQRLRLLLAVKPGTGRLVFQYYFEKFGEVVIPERTPSRDVSPARLGP
jgi:hypothetical protein